MQHSIFRVANYDDFMVYILSRTFKIYLVSINFSDFAIICSIYYLKSYDDFSISGYNF